MITYITQCCRTKNCIAQGMQSYIRITMSEQTESIGDFYSTHNQITAFYQPMHIESIAYTKHKNF